MVHVGLGEGSPFTGTFRVHLHCDNGVAILVKLVLSLSHNLTFQWSTSVLACSADGIEFEDLAGLVHSLHTPLEGEVGGEYLLSHLRVEEGINLGSVESQGITYHATTLSTCGLEHGEEGILLLSLVRSLATHAGSSLFIHLVAHLSQHASTALSRVGLLGCGFCGSSLSGSGSSVGCYRVSGLSHGTSVAESSIELREVGSHLRSVVSLPELKVGTTLKELTYTLWLLDAGEFHHDASALSLNLLDVGLHHAEAVDTCAEHIERVVNGLFHTLT